ncbi:hypothetical protein [Paenibacillus solanacearum]|uniref:hypothetical protein n=1 Tax=Paenibacillus solanacearum TaxID=2048548 RepID=UPI001C4029DD|nr:hypothetical protein [Paenibacillus solanacearum]
MTAEKIPHSAFVKWINRWYISGNKNVFIFELRSIGRLRSKNEIEQIVQVSRLKEKLGSLEDTDKPLEPTMIMFNVRHDDEIVNALEFGFVQLGQLRELDEDNDVITWTPINFYVYVEIDLNNGQLSVWIEPTKKLHKLGHAKKGSFQDVAEEYKKTYFRDIWINLRRQFMDFKGTLPDVGRGYKTR